MNELNKALNMLHPYNIELHWTNGDTMVSSGYGLSALVWWVGSVYHIELVNERTGGKGYNLTKTYKKAFTGLRALNIIEKFITTGM